VRTNKIKLKTSLLTSKITKYPNNQYKLIKKNIKQDKIEKQFTAVKVKNPLYI